MLAGLGPFEDFLGDDGATTVGFLRPKKGSIDRRGFGTADFSFSAGGGAGTAGGLDSVATAALEEWREPCAERKISERSDVFVRARWVDGIPEVDISSGFCRHRQVEHSTLVDPGSAPRYRKDKGRRRSVGTTTRRSAY